jgi:acid phosphatase type 7
MKQLLNKTGQPARRGLCIMAAMLVLAAGPAMADDELFDPLGIFLTWTDDPTTTMVVDFHTDEDAERDSIVEYRQLDSDEWQRAAGDERPFPHTERTIHRVHLTNLSPATTYEFRFGDDSEGYRFRTMPEDLSEPIRFAAGGDVRHRKSWMDRTNRVAMEYDLDFIAWGGDLAYADSRADRAYRWIEWFDSVKETLIDDDGRVVPILAGIGNHEVVGGYYTRHDDYEQTDEGRQRIAQYYYVLFAFPGQPGYGVLDFGDYLSFVLLDTDHTNPIDGAQTEWLEQTLADRTDVTHVFPIYHVTAYPSHRRFGGGVQTRVREYWVPLFEQYNVKVAFENHDHTYKRTHPIRGGEVSDDGIVYIGDGAWGVSTRSGDSKEEWYIDKFASVRHAIIATLHQKKCDIVVVSESGEVIDEFEFEVD